MCVMCCKIGSHAGVVCRIRKHANYKRGIDKEKRESK